jgi:hypothetical protein
VARGLVDPRSERLVMTAPTSLDDPRVVQILATEHWSLLASRTLSWTESFSRASMLLGTLSATVVAFALVAQVDGLGPAFVTFALVVLPFVELVGLATFARLGEANREDLLAIQGMNRIRHAYQEIAPGLAPYFVTGRHDDLPAVLSVYGPDTAAPSSIRRAFHHAFVMTQGMVGTINAMIAGIFGFMLARSVDAPAAVVAASTGACAAIAVIGQTILAVSTYRQVHREMSVRFPSGDTIGPTTSDGHRDGP